VGPGDAVHDGQDPDHAASGRLFVHATALEAADISSLNEGDKVTFR